MGIKKLNDSVIEQELKKVKNKNNKNILIAVVLLIVGITLIILSSKEKIFGIFILLFALLYFVLWFKNIIGYKNLKLVDVGKISYEQDTANPKDIGFIRCEYKGVKYINKANSSFDTEKEYYAIISVNRKHILLYFSKSEYEVDIQNLNKFREQ